METIKVNMSPNPLDVQTIHASQNDGEAREWEFELHNNGELIDTSDVKDQLVFKAYKGGTEQLLPENGSTPTTSPFMGDIKYPQGLLTGQEFLYRESPTEEDGLAKITDIKGNTLVWNQLIQNGNFADTSVWQNYNSTFTVSGNTATVKTTNANNQFGIYQAITFKANHKYFISFEAKKHGTITLKRNRLSSGQEQVQEGLYRTIETASSDYSTTSPIRIIFSEPVSDITNDYFMVKNYMIVDLTQMGLDATASEFTSLFHLPYYDYCKGAMLSFGGRNVKFNQLVQNGNFADSSNWVAEGSSTINSVTNNTINVTTANVGNSGIAQISFPMTNGHQYLLVATIKTTGQTNISVSGIGGVLFNTNSFVTKGGVFTWTAATGNQWSVRIRNFDANSATFEAKNVMLIDLTEMFGAGNEPSAEGFLELFPNDYYEYNVGQYMNLGQPVSLKTVGFNQWDEMWEHGSLGNNGENTGSSASPEIRSTNYIPIVQNASYYLNVPAVAVVHYYGSADLSNYKGNQYIASSQLLNIPNGTNYIRFRMIGSYGDYKNDICLNISDPNRNGTYEPYTESALSIPLDEFPNGMDGINDARDYKNETGYAKMIGQVDLGTLTYTYTQSSLRFEAQMPPNYKIPTSASDRGNMICAKYSTNPNPLLGNGQEGITGYQNSNKVFISDQSTTDPAVFKTMMNGVVLYYELKTPLENYGVVDLGTLTYTIDSGNTLYAPVTGLKGVGQSEMPNILCALFTSIKYSDRGSVSYPNISITSDLNIRFGRTGYTDVNAFKQAMQGVYLLYEKENPQGFTTATLVTENGEVALANENGVLVGKCNSDVSADAGFIEGKIKLSDEDGECYSNKIQLHIERSPQ